MAFRKKSERGVVLLETLLVLPVYLVMLAGVFWLGEIGLIRLALLDGERMRLWENGNWNNHAEQPERDIFNFTDPVIAGRPDISTGAGDFVHTFASGGDEAYGWGCRRAGHATVNTRRAAWSWEIADFSRNQLWKWKNSQSVDSGDVLGANGRRLTARTSDGGAVLESSALFRSGQQTVRKGDAPYSRSTDWNAIYLGSWGEFVVPPTVTAGVKALPEYERNQKYRDWSD